MSFYGILLLFLAAYSRYFSNMPPYLIGLSFPCPLQFAVMIKFDEDTKQMFLSGPEGIIMIPDKDELTYKLAMLYEGECEGLGAEQAAKKYGYSKARYYQLLHLYKQIGAIALQSQKRGPKRLYRRTPEVEQQVVRYLFLDPEASAEVIAQKLRQSGYPISLRSVERVLAKFGLQKKTLRLSSLRRRRRTAH